MYRLIPLLLFLVACKAFAADPNKVIFFVNMNYSLDELATLKKVAKERNQELVVIPPEQFNGIDVYQVANKHIDARIALRNKIKKIHPEWVVNKAGDCDKCEDEMIKLLYDISKVDSLVVSKAGLEIEKYLSTYKQINSIEKDLGMVNRQISQKGKELKRKGKTVDTFALSAHSTGHDFSGETGYDLSQDEVRQLKEFQPEIFNTPRHVLLLGCYTMTEMNQKVWRRDIFPSSSLIFGYSPKAPDRENPGNLKLMEEVLNKAEETDQKVQTKANISLAEIRSGFLGLESIKQLAYNPVFDYCSYTMEANPEKNLLSCSEEWKNLEAQSVFFNERFYNYKNGPTADPPRNTSDSESRDQYDLVHQVCSPQNIPGLSPEEIENKQFFADRELEHARWILFWWHMQTYFVNCNKERILKVNELLSEVGINLKFPGLDKKVGRKEFVNDINKIKSEVKDLKSELRKKRIALASTSTDIPLAEYTKIMDEYISVSKQLRKLRELNRLMRSLSGPYYLEEMPLSWHNKDFDQRRCEDTP